MKLHLSLLLTAIASSPFAGAAVKPNPLFSEGAVLQQGMETPIWGTANDGEKVTVEINGQSASATAKDGKWMVRLKDLKAGGPHTLKISGENEISIPNVLVGEVWLCSGQSNMAWTLNQAANAESEIPLADYPKVRMFTVSTRPTAHPKAEATGKWVECSPATARKFSAVGYFFGRDLHKAKGFPVGLIDSSVGGTPAQAWTSLPGLAKLPELRAYTDQATRLVADYSAAKAAYPAKMAEYEANLKIWTDQHGAAYEGEVKAWQEESKKAAAEGRRPSLRKPKPPEDRPLAPPSPEGTAHTPTTLYNGMIAPLIPYAIKGVIWYQGESNNTKAQEYRTLFPQLIADWREQWAQGDFPFLFVQIAPNNRMTPELREAQLLTLKRSPNTAMTVTTDVGEAGNIHPGQKEPVGARLALAARALAYGEKIEYSGPIFDSLKIDQNRAILTFKHTGAGLVAKEGDLKGFTIAGADKQFVPAKAEIRGETVVVSAEQVPQPVAVRYGWANVPEVNLFNQEGLPASPFRTDVE